GGNQPRSLPEGPKGKPSLGHTPTHKPGQRKHPRQHTHCRALTSRRDTIATGKGTATATLTRWGGAPRQPPCHYGKPGRDSDPYRGRQPRRDKVAPDRGDASTDVGTQADRVMLHPGPPTNHTNTHTRGGEQGESYKANYKTPRTPDPPRLGRAQEIPTFHEERTHEGPFTTHGHLLLAPRRRSNAPPPAAGATTPATPEGSLPTAGEEGKGKKRREREKG
ncbi:hypothetical protein Taro_013132, partial [Colocasia esculenta]|nr:hypothetical protein [Colocasia esculenta]